ncbi:MAG: polymerase [Treponema sp.]|nr:polymerase [Treponema sp.]
MKKPAVFFAVAVFTSALIHAQTGEINGVIEWDRMELSVVVSVDLKKAGLKLPVGRSQAEALLDDQYPALVRPVIMGLQADSSSTLEDFVNRGELGLGDADNLAFQALRIPPALSGDLSLISARYFLSLHTVSAALKKHGRPQDPPSPLVPAAVRDYTGIIIIADESLPVRGRNTAALLRPCLFPTIWDSGMGLVYERNMTNSGAGMVCYVSRESILAGSPSGLDEKLLARVGPNPLRIMARGVFGETPTDPIIDGEDARIILSSEANRRLLREGRVALVLDRSALKTSL